MGLERPAASIDRQSGFAKELSTDFDSWLLRNIVWSVVEADAQLRKLCDCRSVASDAAGIREFQHGEDAAYLGKIEAIEMTVDRLARERAAELVALACAECLADGDQWASNTTFDDARVEEAQAEAKR